MSRPYDIGARAVVNWDGIATRELLVCLDKPDLGKGGGLRPLVATCIAYVLLAMLAVET